MKKNWNLPGLILLWVFLNSAAGCKKDPPPVEPDPDPRDKLTGIFEMRKLENNQIYLMKVEKVGDNCIQQGCDSIKITNYADLFNISVQYTLSSIDSFLNIGIINPAIDKYGKKWKLSYSGNPYPPYNHNVIYNDSIKITFKLSNHLYYQEDSVPQVFDTTITHVGVRIAEIE